MTRIGIILMALIWSTGFHLKAQSKGVDTLGYTTALVELIEATGTTCHLSTGYFSFRVVRWMSGPDIARNDTVFSGNLRGYADGESTKIFQELFPCGPTTAEDTNQLVINFMYNPTPEFSPAEFPRGCWQKDNFLDYGIAQIRWVVREGRHREIKKLDQMLENRYGQKFNLMPEREGKFFFEVDQKKMVAVWRFYGWTFAEIREDTIKD